MARPFVSAQCDLVASYMDGVHVKIAEAYKPPRKIGLPAAYNNRLPDVSKLTYDFSLENSVLKKMCEWRKSREAYNKAFQARLKEKKKKEKKETPPLSPLDCVKQQPINTPAPETTILTPQPLSLPANDLQDHAKTNGDLNYADFDNDTSSPFDNMELKTINDMEELAQVLQPRSQWIPAGKLENIINELTIDDTSKISKEEKVDDMKTPVDSQADEDELANVENHRSVSAIMQELQKELERPVMENWKPWPDLESPDSDRCANVRHNDALSSNHAKSPADSLSNMTEDDLKLVMQLNDMGFPKCRAARAVLELGRVHEKKIVEYLLAIQSLEESGVPNDYAEKALILTQHDQSKARIYYENLCTLKDLGFHEDEVSAALVKCNFDRDKALDILIA
ncbi:Ubiquitin-associated protein 1 [Formica fusca]